jgi:hypothetical protein
VARRQRLPAAVLAAGVVFSLVLVSTTREGAFYSGDGGLKFLLARQLAHGDWRADLRLAAEPWVEELWQRGFYPFERPFVQELGGRRYVHFPIFFPLLTAPLYRVFGCGGLYVIPILSLWCVWLVFLRLCAQAGVSAGASAVALAGLIFSSPLTLYGAMFWEHTLAIALAFGGVMLLLARGDPAPARAFLAGALVGLSAWVRSELVCVAVALFLIVAFSRRLELGRSERRWALVALSLSLVTLAGVNVLLYGYPQGVHGLQVSEPLGLWTRLGNAGANLASLLTLLLTTFPLVVALAACLLVAAKARRIREGLDGHVGILAGLTLLAIVLIPLVLPSPEAQGGGGKQWGPRYLLIVPPLACSVLALLAGPLAALGLWPRRALGGLLAVTFLVGVCANGALGPWLLAQDYRERILPVVRFVRADPARFVAAADSFIPQELAATMDEKTYLFTRSARALNRLGEAALRQGVTRFLYVSERAEPAPRPFGRRAEGVCLRVAPVFQFKDSHFVHEVLVEGCRGPAGAAVQSRKAEPR